MSKYQKVAVSTSFAVVVFFLALSVVTDRWGFFLWSLLPVFMVLMTAFTTNIIKKDNG